uniref:BURP domain-containing protein n=1 Tax=Kalanchoe fedtschenkoi TaxID=63787 RepID=A0A7N0UNU6_KALFE
MDVNSPQVASGRPFTSTDYMAATPSWAVYGADEGGFDPDHTSLKSGNKVFRVSLLDQNNDLIKAVDVCHLDTFQWNPDHLSLRVLNIKLWECLECHFMPADNLIWVPKLNPM